MFQTYAASDFLLKNSSMLLILYDFKNKGELNSKNCSKVYRGSNLASRKHTCFKKKYKFEREFFESM